MITGDDDSVIPAGGSGPLVERIPRARLHTVHGAGHLFFVEEPGETLRVLGDFLAAPGGG